jgi:hypothetical protein
LKSLPTPVKDAFHGFGEVFLHMEPISNLYYMRSPVAGSCGIVTRSITTDELNVRMGLEPTFQVPGGTIRKQIDDSMILKVDQNGAIGDVATKRPVIYPKMGRCGMRCQWCPTNEPQESIRATRYLQNRSNVRTRLRRPVRSLVL